MGVSAVLRPIIMMATLMYHSPVSAQSALDPAADRFLAECERTGTSPLDCVLSLAQRQQNNADERRRLRAAADAYCRYLGERTTAYRNCYAATTRKLGAAGSPDLPRPSAVGPPVTTLPPVPARQHNPCDFFDVRDAIARARPGTDPELLARTTFMVLEANGCRRPR